LYSSEFLGTDLIFDFYCRWYTLQAFWNDFNKDFTFFSISEILIDGLNPKLSDRNDVKIHHYNITKRCQFIQFYERASEKRPQIHESRILNLCDSWQH